MDLFENLQLYKENNVMDEKIESLKPIDESKSYYDDYTTLWPYKKLEECGYILDVDEPNGVVKILFPDGDVYAEFTIEKIQYDENDEPYYSIHDSLGDSVNLGSELEFVETFNDAIANCLFYFFSRY